MTDRDSDTFSASVNEVSHLASPLALGARVITDFRHRAQQKVISDAIVDAVTGRGPRFICISYPQQRGKSMMTSILTPALWIEWHALGIVPGGMVALMSYEDSLPMTWSVKVRRLIQNNPDVFTARVSKEAKAAGYWTTEQEGGLMAIGTAGSIQGRPISLLGIDDPTKNFDQAMSPNHHDRVWDLWTSVLYGRLQPWTVVLVTMARWTPDDLIGRLMSEDYEGDPSKWRYIRIPYVCDADDDPLGRQPGEPMLRPQSDQTLAEAYAEAEETKTASSSYSWSALWQQDPRDDASAIFPESHWRYWGGDSLGFDGKPLYLPTADQFDTVVMSWDMAFKDESYHDWVVGQAWGSRGADRYLIDQVRGHWGFTETCNRVISFSQSIRSRFPKAQTVLVEDKANGTAIIEVLRSKVGGLVDVSPTESKTSRAWSVEPLQKGGNLYIPSRAIFTWVSDFIKETSSYRGEKGSGHDDQVDSMCMALRYLMTHTGQPVHVASPMGIDLSPGAIGYRAHRPDTYAGRR